MLWADQLESRSAEKDMGVLVNTELTRSQAMHACNKGGQQPSGLHQKEHCQPVEQAGLLSTSELASRVLGPALSSPVQESYGHTGGSPGPKRWWRDWSICHSRRGWEIWDCPVYRRESSERDLINVRKCLLRGEKTQSQTLLRGIQWTDKRQWEQN